jgi:hypothetical protein
VSRLQPQQRAFNLPTKFKEGLMHDYETEPKDCSELMSLLLKERSKFPTEEEFKEYAVAEVRRFITDLRSINIELTMRPTFNKIPLSRHSATEKLTSHREN